MDVSTVLELIGTVFLFVVGVLVISLWYNADEDGPRKVYFVLGVFIILFAAVSGLADVLAQP